MATKTIYLPAAVADRRNEIETGPGLLVFGRPFSIDEATADRLLAHFEADGARLICRNSDPRPMSRKEFFEQHEDDWLYGRDREPDSL